MTLRNSADVNRSAVIKSTDLVVMTSVVCSAAVMLVVVTALAITAVVAMVVAVPTAPSRLFEAVPSTEVAMTSTPAAVEAVRFLDKVLLCTDSSYVWNAGRLAGGYTEYQRTQTNCCRSYQSIELLHVQSPHQLFVHPCQ